MKLGPEYLLGDIPIPKRLPGVHKLKQQYRDFLKDLDCCGDLDTFDCLLLSAKATLDRIEAELPDWWHGDIVAEQGLARLIETKRKELSHARF